MPSGNRASAPSDRQHQTNAAANDTADKKWSAPSTGIARAVRQRPGQRRDKQRTTAPAASTVPLSPSLGPSDPNSAIAYGTCTGF
jgi:hypothetical protein